MLIRRNLPMIGLGAAVAFIGLLLALTITHHRYSSQAVTFPDGDYVADVQYVPNQYITDGTEDHYIVSLISVRSWAKPSAVVAVVPTVGTPCVGFVGMSWVDRRTLKVVTDTSFSEGPTSWRDVRVVAGSESCELPGG